MRRRTIIAGALLSSVLLVGCGTADTAPASQGEVEDPDEAEDPGEAEDVDAGEDADADADAGLSAPVDDTSGDTEMGPDADLLADPCADHEGRESDVFIDLAAPVDEQVASGSVELVGCSNVFEATVAWTLLDGDGRVLDEGFTTAECGTGCVGEFRDTVSLTTAADEPVAYLQVFGPNVSDEGPAQLALTEVVIVIG
jgi:hypothetical protein